MFLKLNKTASKGTTKVFFREGRVSGVGHAKNRRKAIIKQKI